MSDAAGTELVESPVDHRSDSEILSSIDAHLRELVTHFRVIMEIIANIPIPGMRRKL